MYFVKNDAVLSASQVVDAGLVLLHAPSGC